MEDKAADADADADAEAELAPQHKPAPLPPLGPNKNYCWTCGPGCRYNIKKCPSPATGHIYMATKRDMQGGRKQQNDTEGVNQLYIT